MPNNIIMADVPSGGLSGDWGKAYAETVTIGENSVTNILDAVSLVVSSRADTTGTFVFIRRRNAESPNPANNEFGGCYLTPNQSGAPRLGIRFKNNKWSTSIGLGTGYDGVISAGSVFDVVSIMQETTL